RSSKSSLAGTARSPSEESAGQPLAWTSPCQAPAREGRGLGRRPRQPSLPSREGRGEGGMTAIACDARRGSALERRDRRFGLLMTAPGLAALVLVAAFPLFFALFTSLYDYTLLNPVHEDFVGLDKYREAVGE